MPRRRRGTRNTAYSHHDRDDDLPNRTRPDTPPAAPPRKHLHRLRAAVLPFQRLPASHVVAKHETVDTDDSSDDSTADNTSASTTTAGATMEPAANSAASPADVQANGSPAPLPASRRPVPSTLSLLRPKPAPTGPRSFRGPTSPPSSSSTSGNTPRFARNRAARIVAASTPPTTDATAHAALTLFHAEDEQQWSRWARRYLSNTTAGPVPKSWLTQRIVPRRARPGLTPALCTAEGERVPSLFALSLVGYLKYLSAHPSAVIPRDVPWSLRELLLFQLPYSVSVTDATAPRWADPFLTQLNLSNAHLSETGLRTILGADLVPASKNEAVDTHAPPDAWEEAAVTDDDNDQDDAFHSPDPSLAPPLVSLDLSFSHVSASTVLRVLAGQPLLPRVRRLTHLNLSGLFRLADGPGVLVALSNALLHLVELEVSYCPWVTAQTVSAVDWPRAWRNLRVLRAVKSLVDARDAEELKRIVHAARPEIRVVTELGAGEDDGAWGAAEE
ncbi:hypothetical protein GGF31_000212 [Allomyces arbusculus]|nr:hypothetical protein GGF31_000212 [Allomyces arbusculus]